MPVQMAVRLSRLHILTRIVSMLVMLIMNVLVFMLGRQVCMDVLVPFAQVQPDADGHQHARDHQR